MMELTKKLQKIEADLKDGNFKCFDPDVNLFLEFERLTKQE